MPRTALFGGSFNPPGRHHRSIAEALSERFDRVIAIPCGPRPDKPSWRETPPVFRAAMAHLAFRGQPKVLVDCFDLEQSVFTRTHALEDRYCDQGAVWHVVGADLVRGGAEGKSEIQRCWERGGELWEKGRFAVVTRPGYPLPDEDLPPTHEILMLAVNGSSSAIREKIQRGESAADMLDPEILAYIERYGLYREAIPNSISRGHLSDPRCLIFNDPRNPRSLALSSQYAPYANETNPNCVLVIGGDGTMLRAIREHWHKRLPFFGINAGHVGFLMNNTTEIERTGFPPGNVVFCQLPLLYIEMELTNGEKLVTRAFNDAWVERSTPQSAWLEVRVNGAVRLPKLVADGALVSTAAGSTAYARSMGAPPLPADTPAWLLVGSNVMEPFAWKSALLSPDTEVELVNLDPDKRPICACVDGIQQGQVKRMRVRLSRVAAAELAFCAGHDMAEKIAALQFSGGG